MPNIMNKEEAERVKEMAKVHWKNKNYDRAEKLFGKSLQLFPLPGVEGMCQRMLREKAGAAGGAAATASRARAASAARTENKAPPAMKGFTAEQAADVKRIKRCGKNPYKILGVETTATDAEIKKAYRKLALKFHPDKNTAPGAEDAFKGIGGAFATLSDADKRAHFDRFGEEAPEGGGGGGGGFGGFRQRGGGGGMGEVDPDEIFRAFFGGGFPGGGGVHFQGGGGNRQQRRQQQGRRQQQDAGGLGQLMQLLPLIVLFMLSFMNFDGGGSSAGSSSTQMPFRLQRDGRHNVKRSTRTDPRTNRLFNGNVRPGIPYYVKTDFDRSYGQSHHYLARVEGLVEQTFEAQAHTLCQQEKAQQKRLVVHAKRTKDPTEKKKKMGAALAFKMTNCDLLSDQKTGWQF